MKNIKFYQVDAFTDQPFKGNPAAICLLEEELSTATMLQIAAENNLAETAFVQKAEDGFYLRWFTPTVEVHLCGHATLATSHILWQEGILKAQETARYHTLSGLLTAKKKGDWIEIDLPAKENRPVDVSEEVLAALQVRPIRTAYADRYIIEVSTPEEVNNVKPDFNILRHHEMVIVTSKGAPSSPYDFVSRTFGPSVGVDEDPVTGSSHCCLVPYYAEQLNKTQFFAYQASQRGGEMRLELKGDRVLLSGHAVTLISGMLLI
ncbi:putative isomerase yddE, PhzC-PhzF family [Arcticibacter svalbardensis MN12-7]|uniref:Putative isomerase yddE, PhzC-PhzF family n=1 Tax=Arcticibacter svalbardensis MN12-7 TaxID=1150600 RepID=R9GPY5_9SPHI|nr:PhzF family phenazine biosynthesis protein [Arcticibacter svalbardensis]EOR93590.1 putative isomerase yddE, PhzC-PhzF family [Arcticibacter svalbardensis MN12-7]